MIESLSWLAVNAPEQRNISGLRDGEGVGPEDHT